MGFLDDYADLEEVEASTGFDVPDGVYDYTVNDFYIKKGTSNDADATYAVLRYDLEMGEKTYVYSEWFKLPVNGDDITENERKTLGRLKSRFLSLSLTEAEANEADPDVLVGLTGKLQIVSVPGKGKNAGRVYQNVRNLRPDDREAVAEPEPAPAPRRTRKPRTGTVIASPASEDAPAVVAAPVAVAVLERPAQEAKESLDDEIKTRVERRRAARKSAVARENPFD